MLIAIANETNQNEKRVALTPDAVVKISKLFPMIQVLVESGAGVAAGFGDAAFKCVGATVLSTQEMAKTKAQIHFRVTVPAPKVALPLAADGWLVCLNPPQKINALALQKLPRTSRAQSMDVLSSQANLAGYAAVLLAAQYFPRLMPMLSTAAGSSKPAQVLILGVGVAGLQAIATARRLGAQVSAFDVRPEVADQIRSLGAKSIDLDLQVSGQGGYAGKMTSEQERQLQTALVAHLEKADIIICTAQVPSAAAPVLVTQEATERLKAGAVLVDMATVTNAAQGLKGGNCPLTQAGQVVVTATGATLLGPTHLTSMVAGDASRFFAQNMVNLLGIWVKNGQLDFTDELIQTMKVS